MSERALTVVVVDDEPPARARLKRMLLELPGVEQVGEAASAAEALRVVEAERPDVLLLDVQMPGGDGFSLLPLLQHQPAVVFTTAYDQYAVQAFEASAVDYLLKPFRAERLAAAFERVRDQRQRPEERVRQLEALLEQLGRPAPRHIERLTVRLGLRQLILKVEDVLWFGAEDKLVFAATASTRHYVDFTLDELEAKLDPARFFRVHRSAIAALDHVVAMRPAFAGTWRLQMDDPARTEVPVARARARQQRERIGA